MSHRKPQYSTGGWPLPNFAPVLIGRITAERLPLNRVVVRVVVQRGTRTIQSEWALSRFYTEDELGVLCFRSELLRTLRVLIQSMFEVLEPEGTLPLEFRTCAGTA